MEAECHVASPYLNVIHSVGIKQADQGERTKRHMFGSRLLDGPTQIEAPRSPGKELTSQPWSLGSKLWWLWWFYKRHEASFTIQHDWKILENPYPYALGKQSWNQQGLVMAAIFFSYLFYLTRRYQPCAALRLEVQAVVNCALDDWIFKAPCPVKIGIESDRFDILTQKTRWGVLNRVFHSYSTQAIKQQ